MRSKAAGQGGQSSNGKGVKASQLARQKAEKQEAAARATESAQARAAMDLARAWLDAQPNRVDLLARFESTLTKPSLIADYTKQGLDAPLVAAKLAEFMTEQLS